MGAPATIAPPDPAATLATEACTTASSRTVATPAAATAAAEATAAHTDFTTSAQKGTVAADPLVRQNDIAASALSAKIYEDRMKISVERDVSEEASMKVMFSIVLPTTASIRIC
jgi:hypothetical protein